ncbi:cache domain-containing protein [Magnetofaba australis]|uniref:Putative Cache domain-containing protein n=1 Tax=Magnetofaba australis IT-1 TaxID=1434232 RepID=A0A1Y2K048_9PROT|nr:cache domain-containing protein [Magnetofaba australis]OSM01413.1 putative Cache domain-containing protein [Magnetofaba australis IT-1]
MKKWGRILAVAALMISGASAANASDMATPEEAKELTIKAMALVESQGKDAAFKAFAQEGGEFLPKDLYMFCMDLEGVMTFHAKKPQLAGKNLMSFNKYGDMLFKDMIDKAKADGEGWVNYKWPYPGSEEIREKASYIKTDAAKSFFCGAGAYK